MDGNPDQRRPGRDGAEPRRADPGVRGRGEGRGRRREVRPEAPGAAEARDGAAGRSRAARG